MKLKGNMILTEVGGVHVAVSLDGDDGFKGIVRLNETGVKIWKGIAEGLTKEQIADQLVEEYDNVDHPRALSSVQKIVDQLIAGGLLEE